ncbi:hypothetical protein Z955_14620 [Clostridium botulinum C/D str. DC5]|uniref:HTH crp-type domain-containing protein n=1 Tax=Clostridium botulinum C/D str. DC5 TaxID=1443128 RepID=A0A0A0HZX6_CLOBO|nr:hypothetical protein Z955_14620 [Clostridium botulinum C/D str. DC5]
MYKRQGIYIVELNNVKKSILIDAKFILSYKLNSSEVGFIYYIVFKYYTSNLNDWIIIKFDEVSEDLGVTKGTISKWLKKLEQKNILIHEDFRSTLWKFNNNIEIYEISSR